MDPNQLQHFSVLLYDDGAPPHNEPVAKSLCVSSRSLRVALTDSVLAVTCPECIQALRQAGLLTRRQVS